jgi:hypothetical protein
MILFLHEFKHTHTENNLLPTGNTLMLVLRFKAQTKELGQVPPNNEQSAWFKMLKKNVYYIQM